MGRSSHLGSQYHLAEQLQLNHWLQQELKPRLIELDQIRQRGIGMQPYWEISDLS